jgi:poly-gamma-glutamate capsule biosynthesis protein CapA/YwtB (metallophosphatase superfamily)
VEPIRLFFAGDVMTGRGIDQVLPHPVSPILYEPLVTDARTYVQLAEIAHGPIPRPVDFAYIWGDALDELERAEPDLRIVNLETAVTCNEEPWPGKDVLYRMNPRNVACLTAAGVDCCSLANNHTLDWGREGLLETLETLDHAGVRYAGAGRTDEEAKAPAVLRVESKGRVLVFAFGSPTSGIPRTWGAARDRPGVNLLEHLSASAAERVARDIRGTKEPGDLAVASIHWGGNWGYEIPREQVAFAHRLVESGVDVVYAHSSHHVKTIEVYRGHLILYGCGDFVDDYEGITGYKAYRDDLTLLYLASIDPQEGRLVEARLVPMQLRRFRLNRASTADAQWLCDLLNRLGAPCGTRVRLREDNSMTLSWRPS